ncbi:hypothetical protein PIB30_066400 [Stylosanthes scabra]|uniref:CCHC-type domain-containing protein n=1 Tax=Stylosanthes scabra TaxID=79078 RepID=A0ABU6YMK7_9FABA|nr:hypothetical protein [Stylosanthes scabra]
MSGSFNNGGRARGRGGRGRNGGRGSTKLCSYCGKMGHLVDTCYHKHGFPPHMQRNQSRQVQKFGTAAVNSMTTPSAEMNKAISIVPASSTQKEASKEFDALFSKEQKQALIALFQQLENPLLIVLQWQPVYKLPQHSYTQIDPVLVRLRQDLHFLKMIGVAEQKGGLYALKEKSHIPKDMILVDIPHNTALIHSVSHTNNPTIWHLMTKHH